jgi:NADH-quinone oxidoreductase subunit C
MDLSHTPTILKQLSERFNINFETDTLSQVPQPYLTIKAENLYEIAQFLNTEQSLFFDFLNCITAIDNGSENGTIDVVYHLTSIPFGHSLILKVCINREITDIAILPSLSDIWKTADWHEREIYDFFGVRFSNHPDLRRILLPADWEGFPMRKDYEEQEFYHDIKVKF